MCFRVDTGHRPVLAILTIKKAAFQGACGVKCGKSSVDTVAVEVCPNTAPNLREILVYHVKGEGLFGGVIM